MDLYPYRNGPNKRGRTNPNAGTITPAGATVTYQWQVYNTATDGYDDIDGATGATYTLVEGDEGKFIRVVATGSGDYAGTVTSAPVGPVTVGP